METKRSEEAIEAMIRELVGIVRAHLAASGERLLDPPVRTEEPSGWLVSHHTIGMARTFVRATSAEDALRVADEIDGRDWAHDWEFTGQAVAEKQ